MTIEAAVRQRADLTARTLKRLEIHGEWGYHMALREAAQEANLEAISAILGGRPGTQRRALQNDALRDAAQTLITNCPAAETADFEIADEIFELVGERA